MMTGKKETFQKDGSFTYLRSFFSIWTAQISVCEKYMCSARELAHSRRLTLTRTKKTVKPKMQPVTSTRRSYRWEEGQEGYVAWALKPLAEVVKDTHGHTMSCTIACPQQPERSLSLGLRFSSPQRCRQFFFFFFYNMSRRFEKMGLSSFTWGSACSNGIYCRCHMIG